MQQESSSYAADRCYIELVRILLLLLMVASPVYAEILDLTGTQDGSIWIGTSSGLYRYDQKNAILVSPGHFYALTPAAKGLWAASDEGLLNCTISTCTKNPEVKATGIRFLAGAGERIWMATNSEVFEFHSGITEQVALPQTSVQALTANSNGVWIAARGWVGRTKSRHFEKIRQESAQAIEAEADDVVWIASGFDIYRWEKGEMRTFSLPGPPPNVRMRPPVKAIHPSTKDALWIGTYTDLFLLKDGSIHKIASGLEVTALFEDHQSVLWIGTTEGLKVLMNGKLKNISLPEK